MLMLLALLCSPSTAAEPTPDASMGFQILIEESIETSQAAALWVIYAATLQSTANEATHPRHQTLQPTFAEELEARRALVTVWNEMRKGKRKKALLTPTGAYVAQLNTLAEQGFLREYVWVFLRRPHWTAPPDMQLELFTSWKAVNLANHAPQTLAEVAWDPSPAPGDLDLDAQALEAKAALEDHHRPQEAAALATDVLGVDPDHPSALWTRALAMLQLARPVTDPDARGRLERLAVSDIERLVDKAPDSDEAALALQSFGSQPALRLPKMTCPPEADAAFQEAEVHFQAAEWTEALAEYDRGLDICPTHAHIWVYSGDALYSLKDFDGAIARYEHAIELVPCHWQAHRFRGHLLSTRDPVASKAAYVQALACNPSYIEAWKSVENVSTRVSSPRPLLHDGRVAFTDGPVPDGLEPVYTAWSTALQTAVSSGASDPHVDALRTALETYTSLPERPPSAFFDHMATADAAGFLAEAIHIQLFVPTEIPNFLSFREDHLDRLAEYLDTLVVRDFDVQ